MSSEGSAMKGGTDVSAMVLGHPWSDRWLLYCYDEKRASTRGAVR